MKKYFLRKLPEAIRCCLNKVVVMEMMLHAFVPSFISMRATIGNEEKIA